jgi:CheY-like chemotaxis protein
LIVEDGRDNADSLAILLRARGAEVRCAYSGSEGIDQSARWTPSLILVDIGLPDMTGFEVARRILEQGSRALLVAVTGFSDPRRRIAPRRPASRRASSSRSISRRSQR